MMHFKILQSKEIELEQLPMMPEITLLTTLTVIMVLLNGKMIVHKIAFKIKVIIYKYIIYIIYIYIYIIQYIKGL